jgi:predicted O-methyltransferase YrrM
MVDITRAQRIEGWMDDPDLIWLAEQASTHNTIAEVGSWVGRSTRALADNTSGCVYAIDTWKGSDEPTFDLIMPDRSSDWPFKTFLQNMEGLPAGRVIPFRLTSLESAAYFNHMGVMFDMVFIDASHDYENVKADIAAWLPLIQKGGIMCGHDYVPQNPNNWPGVVQAVNEFFPAGVRQSEAAIWCVEIG